MKVTDNKKFDYNSASKALNDIYKFTQLDIRKLDSLNIYLMADLIDRLRATYSVYSR